MLTRVPQFVHLEQSLDKYTLVCVKINRESRIRVQPRAFGLSRNVCSWKLDSSMPLRRKAARGSHSPDDIEEYAFVVVLQVGQLVGEVGEVVAHASLQVVANVMIDRRQRAAAALTYNR